MPNGRVIFNKRGRWDWLDSGCDIDEDELKQEEWFVAICIIRQTLNTIRQCMITRLQSGCLNLKSWCGMSEGVNSICLSELAT